MKIKNILLYRNLLVVSAIIITLFAGFLAAQNSTQERSDEKYGENYDSE